MPPSTTQTSGFFRLPPEIRFAIYEDVVGTAQLVHVTTDADLYVQRTLVVHTICLCPGKDTEAYDDSRRPNGSVDPDFAARESRWLYGINLMGPEREKHLSQLHWRCSRSLYPDHAYERRKLDLSLPQVCVEMHGDTALWLYARTTSQFDYHHEMLYFAQKALSKRLRGAIHHLQILRWPAPTLVDACGQFLRPKSVRWVVFDRVFDLRLRNDDQAVKRLQFLQRVGRLVGTARVFVDGEGMTSMARREEAVDLERALTGVAARDGAGLGPTASRVAAEEEEL